MPERFYQVMLSNRPAYMGDIGNFIQIAGIIWQGGGKEILMYLPDHPSLETPENEAIELHPESDYYKEQFGRAGIMRLQMEL